MTLDGREREHVFERLRSGLVPERGLDAFAVNVERQRNEVGRLLGLAVRGEGVFKFLRGGYGCGKTFMSRLAVLDAQAKGFATSFVVVSDNDFHLHKFDVLYRRVVGELGTSACPRGALGDILDRWIASLEEALVALGVDDEAPDFDDRVRAKLEESLASISGGQAPEDMLRVVRAIFDLKQAGELGDAGALLSWLAGSQNVTAGVKRKAQIRGDIHSNDALTYLRGILGIIKATGYRGLVIVVDEVETVLRMRKDVRAKSLNGLRQIIDKATEYPGLLWMFTGTPDFFDSRRGVAGLAPLHDRIGFLPNGSLRQAQLELKPFDAGALTQVALKLRDIYGYGSKDQARLEGAVPREFVEQLVAQVTEGFKGDVGVVPRQFLRRLVDVFDKVEDDPEYEPMSAHDFTPTEMTPEEESIVSGRPLYDPDSDGDEASGTVVEF